MLKPFILSLWILVAVGCSVTAVADDDTNQTTVDVDRPAVIFLAPQNNSQFVFGATINLYAEARDLGSGVTRIEFYDNFDTLIGAVDALSPQGSPTLTAIVPWTPPTQQRHFVRVQALRADGVASPQQEISIEVVASEGRVIPQMAQATATTAPVSDANTNSAPVEAQPSPSPAPTGLTATVIVDALNVRTSPTTNAGIAAPALTANTSINLIGRSADSQWYAYTLSSGSVGWVFGNSLQIDGDPATLPLVTTE